MAQRQAGHSIVAMCIRGVPMNMFLDEGGPGAGRAAEIFLEIIRLDLRIVMYI